MVLKLTKKERKMKFISMSKILGTIAITIVMAGCTGNSPAVNQNLHYSPKGVVKVKNNYYLIPTKGYYRKNVVISTKSKKEKLTSEMVKVLTNGKFKMKNKYLPVYTQYGERKFRELISESQKINFNKYPNITKMEDIMKIPKVNKIGAKMEALVISGQIFTVPPLTSSQVAKYKKQQRILKQKQATYARQQARMNNDPRVVAARIQANATAQQTRAIQQQTRAYEEQQSRNRIRAMGNSLAPKTVNVKIVKPYNDFSL